MRPKILCAAALFASTAIALAVTAPTAEAAPRCTDVGPNTTQCQTNGSAQIVTSPTVTTEIWGWPYGGGLVIGLGGLGR
ncbi:hypothetical protein ABQF17_16195 [Mycolicibacterium elephantis]|uniref:hypothetical protein n=1 Tax=Mycolicibacterium elephantis TaxID=81858 RepID=UPI000629987E|nr:hypothetical protein [Mycolicibacterium elephantis]KKW66633.1 hypothetical protein AAV95_00360 [Mycolicibacterium elephantis]OBE98226.1 hypothetical protein A5776_14480 [Mycolicibacterium elephantis]